MQVYTGIDWSENKHDVLFMNEKGAVITYFVIPHTPDGFRKFDDARKKLGVSTAECLVGLETAHNIVIDFLWSRNYNQVYVIPPNVTKSCHGRYRQSGAYTDKSAAFLLADLLRTDRHRLQSWHQYSLGVLLYAYREFEARVGELAAAPGIKREAVLVAFEAFVPGHTFTVSELERICPTVSRATIRRVMDELRKKGQVECLGRGRAAKWRKA